MAYIGNNVQVQGFTPAIDYFNGDAVTVTFTLSRPIASVAQVIVAIDNVVQNSSTAYSVSGNSITFTSAPLAGSNNIWVQYTSPITTYAAISQDPSVIGDITATGGYLAVGDFGNTYTDGTIVDYVTGMARITTGPADGLTIYNGGTSARNALMTLDASGNMGVGTTSPQAPLNVSYSNSSRTDCLRLTNTNTGGYGPWLNFYCNYNGGYSLAKIGTENDSTGGDLRFHTADTSEVSQERMRIGSGGGVGIGTTTTTAAPLTVYAGSGNTAVLQKSGGAAALGFGSDTTANFLMEAINGGGMTFYTGSGSWSSPTWTQRMQMNSTGNVGIGVAPSSGDRFTIKGIDATSSSTSISITNGSGTSGLFIRGDNYLNSGAINNYGTTGTTVIITGGYVGYLSSSIKTKKDVVDYDKGLTEVAKLRPVYYKSSVADPDGNYDGRRYAGFIAEEVKELGLEEYIDYKDGEVASLKYGQMTAILCKAIQELKAEVDSLKAQLEAK